MPVVSGDENENDVDAVMGDGPDELADFDKGEAIRKLSEQFVQQPGLNIQLPPGLVIGDDSF